MISQSRSTKSACTSLARSYSSHASPARQIADQIQEPLQHQALFVAVEHQLPREQEDLEIRQQRLEMHQDPKIDVKRPPLGPLEEIDLLVSKLLLHEIGNLVINLQLRPLQVVDILHVIR